MKILTHSAVAMCLILSTGATFAASDIMSKENTQESMSDSSKLDDAKPINGAAGGNMNKGSMSHEGMPKESMSNDSKPKEGVSKDSMGTEQMKN
jgi:hypothetical protein